ncbi:tetratricopeptide repeat protein [Brachyspira hyodysenteriae]|uniref:tetratricopeptide repeat protein n=2 Tax=Brachyspira hyodysenteriae TaxID=159 RepID=UPI0022CD8A24|nr:tetratricopeptide repeat protein [Brachyspira hyodysenteriae]MCZ9874220.1 tetratricopeptide repeat protein [Brachyspira hyodysenteriae]MCZ9886298.1 tetratricopeptide repeat protein [Brachyspira hyodysenteriae]
MLKAKYFTYKKEYSLALEYYFEVEDYNNLNINNKYILYRNIAWLYYKLKDFNKAIDYYDIAINKLGIIAYYDKAILYYNIERYDKALENMNIYCKRNSNNLSSIDYYHRAVYNGLNDNLESAYNDFLKGLNVTPNSTKHLFEMVELLYERNKKFENKFYDLIKIILDRDFYIENDNITTVYKYRSINEDTKKLILDSKARLSDYNYFNDPADPLIKLNKEALKVIEEYINNIKICSLSPTYDNFSYVESLF